MADQPWLSQPALDALVRRIEGRAARTLVEVLARVQARLPLSMLEQAILANNMDAAIRAIGLDPVVDALHTVHRLAADVRREAFARAVADLPPRLRPQPLVKASLDAFMGEQIQRAQAMVARDLIRIEALRRTTEDALRLAIRDGIAGGISARDLARRIQPLIGLNAAQAGAVAKIRTRLERQGIPGVEVERTIKRETLHRLRYRAQTIAATEVMQALNDGKRLQWDQLVANGTIRPEDWEREWVTADDDLTCKSPEPACKPFDGTRAPIGGTFTSRTGTVSPGPVLHPRCRCIERLQLRGFRTTDNPRRGLLGVPATPAPTPATTVHLSEETAARESPAQTAERLAFERQRRNEPVEWAYVRLSSGETKYYTSNSPTHVSFGEDIQAMVGAPILVHNHPRGSAISGQDLKFALNYRIAIMRVIGNGPDGPVSYEADIGRLHGQRMPDGRAIDGALIATFWTQHYDATFAVARRNFNALRASGMSEDDAGRVSWYHHSHEVLERLAAQLQFTYRRRP